MIPRYLFARGPACAARTSRANRPGRMCHASSSARSPHLRNRPSSASSAAASPASAAARTRFTSDAYVGRKDGLAGSAARAQPPPPPPSTVSRAVLAATFAAGGGFGFARVPSLASALAAMKSSSANASCIAGRRSSGDADQGALEADADEEAEEAEEKGESGARPSPSSTFSSSSAARDAQEEEAEEEESGSEDLGGVLLPMAPLLPPLLPLAALPPMVALPPLVSASTACLHRPLSKTARTHR